MALHVPRMMSSASRNVTVEARTALVRPERLCI